MRLDKEQLMQLTALPDKELWEKIVEFARGYGFTLPEKTPPPEQMQKLRGAVNPSGKANLGEALKVINEYRRGGKK